MPLYIVAQMHAKPGCAQRLRASLLEVVEPTRAEAGCMEIHICSALRDPDTFFIQSAWTDEGEFDKHATLPHTQAFLARLPELIDHELRAVRCVRLA